MHFQRFQEIHNCCEYRRLLHFSQRRIENISKFPKRCEWSATQKNCALTTSATQSSAPKTCFQIQRLLTKNVSSMCRFDFGPHYLDQCDNPVAEVTNYLTVQKLEIPVLNSDGSCTSPVLGYCVGSCVTVRVRADEEKISRPVNVIVGEELPNPGTCSSVAVNTNWPKKEWDFSATGKCGQGGDVLEGIPAIGYWNGCFVHDVCVWARCTANDLVAGGTEVNAITKGLFDPILGLLDLPDLPDRSGEEDLMCGFAYQAASNDFSTGNVEGRFCLNDDFCGSGLNCVLGACRVGRPRGSLCANDSDCIDYCEKLYCYDGRRDDPCGTTADCQSGLRCRNRFWPPPPDIKRCR